MMKKDKKISQQKMRLEMKLDKLSYKQLASLVIRRNEQLLILELLSQGLTEKEIAKKLDPTRKLGMTTQKVKNRLKEISKLFDCSLN